jgi:hypothetical protein
MKRITSLCLTFLLILGLEWFNPQPLLTEEPIPEPILENYSMTHGGNQGGTPSGVKAIVFDQSFGGGTAKALIVFNTKENFSRLALRVWRKVEPGETTFALLVFRVEVRGYDPGSGLLYSRDLEGFSFGDSSSGNWLRKLRDLPANLGQIKITFVGNYE